MQEFKPIEYIYIYIANAMGLDKETYETRINWVKDNLDVLEEVENPKEKYLYYKGVKELRKVQSGKPTGLPILFDAISSGPQILSCITGCKSGAKATGLINTGKRPNAYMEVFNKMKKIVGDENLDLPYDNVKKAIMTACYGSTENPKELIGKYGYLDAFYEACETVLEGTFRLLPLLLSTWDTSALRHHWVLPDNFHADIPVLDVVENYLETPELEGRINIVYTENRPQAMFARANAANITHSIDGYILRTIIRRCSYDREALIEKQTKITKELKTRSSVNTPIWSDITLANGSIKELSTEALVGLYVDIEDMLSRPSFRVMTVHDCFGAHPNYMNHLRYWYNHTLARLHQSNILDDIYYHLTGEKINVVKSLGLERQDFTQEIMDSDYSIC